MADQRCGCNGNCYAGRFARRHPGEPLASDANNGKWLAFDPNLLSGDRWVPAKPIAPEFITDHRDLRCRAAMHAHVIGFEQAPEERCDTQLRIEVSRDGIDVILEKRAVYLDVGFHSEGEAEHAGKHPLSALEFLKHRIRKGRRRARVHDEGKMDELLGLANGQVSEG